MVLNLALEAGTGGFRLCPEWLTNLSSACRAQGCVVLCFCQAWKPGSQQAGEKIGVAGLLLGRTERAARAAELQLCAQAR